MPELDNLFNTLLTEIDLIIGPHCLHSTRLETAQHKFLQLVSLLLQHVINT